VAALVGAGPADWKVGMGKTISRFGLPFAIGLALALRLHVIRHLDFDGLYGQDSFAYFYHGFALWHNHALEYHWPWLPTPTRLFWPMGFPTLLGLGFLIVGHASANAAQIITLCGGLAITALTYGLALRFACSVLPRPVAHAAALCASALIACSGLQVQASVTIMSDAPALAWALLALWLWTGPTEGTVRRRAGSFLAGVSLAAAIVTRYEYAPLIVAPLVYWWMTAVASRTPERYRRGAPSLRLGLLGAVLAGLPQLIYSAGYSAPILHNEWLTGWSLRHLWQANFSTPDGVQHYAHSIGAFYLIRPLVAPESLPWILAPFLPLGLLAFTWNSNRQLTIPFRWSLQPPISNRDPGPPLPGTHQIASTPWSAASQASDEGNQARLQSGPYLALLLSWWLIPTLYLVGVPFESARFALVAQPALAIGEGIGLAWAAWLLFLYPRKYGRTITLAALLWAGCGLTLAATNSEGSVAVLAQGKTSDQAAITWIRAHAASGSAVATFDLTLMLYHYGNLDQRHLKLYDLSAINAADWAALADAPHVLVVVNVGNLDRQWQGLPPDQSFRRLIAEKHLTPIAEAGAYTMYG
jgi:hypothetical protein